MVTEELLGEVATEKRIRQTGILEGVSVEGVVQEAGTMSVSERFVAGWRYDVESTVVLGIANASGRTKVVQRASKLSVSRVTAVAASPNRAAAMVYSDAMVILASNSVRRESRPAETPWWPFSTTMHLPLAALLACGSEVLSLSSWRSTEKIEALVLAKKPNCRRGWILLGTLEVEIGFPGY